MRKQFGPTKPQWHDRTRSTRPTHQNVGNGAIENITTHQRYQGVPQNINFSNLEDDKKSDKK